MVWIVRTQSETDELKTHLPMEYLDDGQERVAAMERAIIDSLLARFRGEHHEPYSSPDWNIALVRNDLDPAGVMPLYTGYRFPPIDRPLKYKIQEPLGKRRLPDIIGQMVFVPDEVRDMIEAIECDDRIWRSHGIHYVRRSRCSTTGKFKHCNRRNRQECLSAVFPVILSQDI